MCSLSVSLMYAGSASRAAMKSLSWKVLFWQILYLELGGRVAGGAQIMVGIARRLAEPDGGALLPSDRANVLIHVDQPWEVDAPPVVRHTLHVVKSCPANVKGLILSIT